MPLSADIRATLGGRGVDPLVITSLDHPDRRITDETSFANFLAKCEEVQTLLLDQVGDPLLKADSVAC